jgi:hypothetical protein
MTRLWIVIVIIALSYMIWRHLRKRIRRAAIRAGSQEQALLLRLRLPTSEAEDETPRIVALEEAIESALRESRAGEFDGHDLRDGVWTLYLYGPDANRILESVGGVVRGARLDPGSHAIMRFGGRGAREERVPLASGGVVEY